jgi:hypothetical protein
MASSLPKAIVATLGAKFMKRYDSLRCDHQFFGNRTLYYCESCSTGFVAPRFDEHELDAYYEQSYWAGRLGERPEAGEEKKARIIRGQTHCQWLAERIAPVDTLIDFGCGECCAAIAFSEAGFARNIVCYDKSDQARQIAHGRGFGYTDELNELPQADFFYSSHSLEHVHDLQNCFEIIVSKIRPGGHLFFEVPNMRNAAICLGLRRHTPHTYMISVQTFERLASHFGLKLLASEEAGKLWSGLMGAEDADLQYPTSLRVLLRKD